MKETETREKSLKYAIEFMEANPQLKTNREEFLKFVTQINQFIQNGNYVPEIDIR